MSSIGYDLSERERREREIERGRDITFVKIMDDMSSIGYALSERERRERERCYICKDYTGNM